MKKQNITILFILTLIICSVLGYFFYLDKIYENKFITKSIVSLKELKKTANMPILAYADKKELDAKVKEYNDIIIELNLNAIAEINKNTIIIKGAINSNYSYVVLKKFLDIIKNDEVNLLSLCMGKGCTKDNYGFLIKIRPYALKLK